MMNFPSINFPNCHFESIETICVGKRMKKDECVCVCVSRGKPLLYICGLKENERKTLVRQRVLWESLFERY